MDFVKVCPTCGTENAPTAARCGCGAFLIGIDLVERASGAEAPPLAVADTIADADRTAPGASPRLAAGPVCNHVDCAQPNPAGTEVCVYCNRPLASAPVSVAPERAPEPESGVSVRRSLISLPAGLAARFEIREPLKAAGGEADLFIVAYKATRERAVLKLYRHGIEPPTDVLERVSKAAPTQLVHLIEHGRDEGVPYELLEYCEHGSLRALLKGNPLPLDAARTLLTELADAVAHLHACGIVHRDLKPENVLVRGLLPLDLVLTDFGIASVTDATMHYTSAARTLRYSAPEAGSNWVGRPTDYWALGMMLVEALTGRHPFDGLSEAVIAHWLVTRPIDVSGVEDPRWQRLCRGLLTRDPKQRWGGDEIERWLAGDETLTVAIEQGEAPAAGDLAPYNVGSAECRTARELAIALAAHWPLGVKDLKRGMLRAWLQNDLRDQNLARAAADAEEAIDQSDDERLLRLLRKLDPALPPVFKGYDVSMTGLTALVRSAMESENEARQTVFELLERNLLQVFPIEALHEAVERFTAAKQDFEQTIAQAIAAGAPRTVTPQGREWQLRMLLFVLDPPKELLQSLRASAVRVGSGAAQRCEWYRALGTIEDAGPARLAAMILLGPPAAQVGMEIERERAHTLLQALAPKIDAHPRLVGAHAPVRDELFRTIESSHDERELLAACDALTQLDGKLERSIETLFADEAYEARPVREAERIRQLQQRIGDWAAWRAGEDWRVFGERIELLGVFDRRSYHVEVGTQYESRRVAYKYSASDVARMPAAAQAALDDVWSCRMPALPAFGADVKLERPQEVQCPRCGVRGRAELQEAWGSMAYPFSTTYACHDKVGVQCQTRMGHAAAHLGVPGAPEFVSEFIDAHASLDPSPERMLEFEVERVSPAWIERAAATVSSKVGEMLARADEDVRSGERIARQRLRVAWTGVTEVRYRFSGREYVIWIPERVDVIPIAVEHPLPSVHSAAASTLAPGQSAADATHGDADIPTGHGGAHRREEEAPAQPRSSREPARFGRLRSIGLWLAASIVIVCLIMWMVNWKP